MKTQHGDLLRLTLNTQFYVLPFAEFIVFTPIITVHRDDFITYIGRTTNHFGSDLLHTHVFLHNARILAIRTFEKELPSSSLKFTSVK